MLYAVNEFIQPLRRRDASETHGPLPDRRRPDAAPAPWSPTRDTVEEIIDEVAATRITERGATRADDRVTEAAMEDRKREGYF